MTPHQPNDWKHLAERASIEMDPEKFMALIQGLNRVLLEREQMICQQRPVINPHPLKPLGNPAQP